MGMLRYFTVHILYIRYIYAVKHRLCQPLVSLKHGYLHTGVQVPTTVPRGCTSSCDCAYRAFCTKVDPSDVA